MQSHFFAALLTAVPVALVVQTAKYVQTANGIDGPTRLRPRVFAMAAMTRAGLFVVYYLVLVWAEVVG